MIFLANLPIAAVVLALGARVLPARRRSHKLPAFDWRGVVVVFLLLSALVLGVTRVVDGFAGAVLWPGFLGAAILLLALLVCLERRAE